MDKKAMMQELVNAYLRTHKPFCPEGPDDLATRGYIAAMIETLADGDKDLVYEAFMNAKVRLEDALR